MKKRMERKRKALLVLGTAGMGLVLGVIIFFGGVSKAIDVPGEGERTGNPISYGMGNIFHHLPMAFVPNLGQWENPARFFAAKGPMQAFFGERGWVFTLGERGRIKGFPGKPGRPVDPEVLFLARHSLPVPGRMLALRMTFLGAGEESRVHGEGRLPGVHHYFLGRDRSRWRADVPLYSALAYEGLYPGVKVRVREGKGLFEYDLILEPGADLGRVKVKVEGAEGLRIGSSGDLVMETGLGEVCQAAPETWEVLPGGRKRALACRFVLLGKDTFGFEAPGRDEKLPLFLDPGLIWSTYVGGGDFDHFFDLAVDKTGEVTLAGRTNSVNYPVTVGVYQPKFKSGKYRLCDAVVTRLNRLGTGLVWSTFFGGKGDDIAWAVSGLPGGAVALGGVTTSRDLPVTKNCVQGSYQGGDDYGLQYGYNRRFTGFYGDSFLTALGPQGRKLLYSTYLGGKEPDALWAMDSNSKGMVAVTGTTKSKDFPVTPGCFDPTFNGPSWPHPRDDAFVTVLEPLTGKLAWSTFLGTGDLSKGPSFDRGHDLVMGEDGHVTVVGSAGGPDFPVTKGAWSTKYNPYGDDFITRFAPGGKSLVWSTFLCGYGKVGIQKIYAPYPEGIDEDRNGNVYFAGTQEINLPWEFSFPTTPYAWDRFGWYDFKGVVVKMDSRGTKILWSTFFGLTSHDHGLMGSTNLHDLVVDGEGCPVVVGETTTLIPVTPSSFGSSLIPPMYGFDAAFVTRLGPLGRKIYYSTHFFGVQLSRKDTYLFQTARALDVTKNGVATVAGYTGYVDFPVTSSAFQTYYGGGGLDAFVFRLPLFTPGVKRIGESTHHAEGEPALYVTASPQEGSRKFGFEGWKAPGKTYGVLIVGRSLIPQGTKIMGITLYVQPGVLFLVKSGSDLKGRVSLPLPAGTRGAKIYAQMIWLNTPPYGSKGTLSSTGALEVTVQ